MLEASQAHVKKKYNRNLIIDNLAKVILFFMGIFAIIALIFIIAYLFLEGADSFIIIPLDIFLLGTRWFPVSGTPSFGAIPLIMGTLLVSMLSLVVSIPLGIGSAIFIAVYAPKKIKDFLKVFVELLAGVPSVVYGLFGMMVVTQWISAISGNPSGNSVLAGAIVLGIMAVPTITSVSEDAISAVSQDLWEGSLALGMTRWQTVRNVILPAAFSGIGAAVILGVGRALGETMAVIMVTGNAPRLPMEFADILLPVLTITAAIGIEMGEVARGSAHYKALFGMAIILFIIVLTVNITANYMIRRIKSKTSTNRKKRSGNIKRRAKHNRLMNWMMHVVPSAGILVVTWMAGGWIWTAIAAAAITGVIIASKVLPTRVI